MAEVFSEPAGTVEDVVNLAGGTGICDQSAGGGKVLNQGKVVSAGKVPSDVVAEMELAGKVTGVALADRKQVVDTLTVAFGTKAVAPIEKGV